MIYSKIKNFIERNGIVQKMISEKTGLSEVAICELLNGKRKIEINEYLAICKALNVHYSFFIDERNDSDKSEETA